MNQRAIIKCCSETGTTETKLKDYIESFDVENIMYKGKNFLKVKEVLCNHGLGDIRQLGDEQDGQAKDTQVILLVEKEYLETVAFEDQFIYCVFSLDDLQVGPVIIKGTTGCPTCYLNQVD